MTIEDMIEELIHYYEAAGFSDVYERKLKVMSDDELVALYRETFKSDIATEEEMLAMGFFGGL